MRNLAATDRRFDRKLTPVCVHPSFEYLTSGDHTMQTQPVPLTIGADVAKDEIVVACAEQSFAPRAIANRRPALVAFLKTLPPGSRIGMESTGTYHELFAMLAHKMGFVVFVLNPKDTRHYAKAVGQRGKTDLVDAKLIARFVDHEHAKLHLWIPPTPEQRQLNRLLKRRAKLSSIKASLAQSLKGLRGFSTELKALVERVQHVIARIDVNIKALIEASTERQQNYTRLLTIPSVGSVVGSGVLVHLERLPFANADAFVAFTGLDPRPDDSGHYHGRRRLSKRGPSELRRLLYLAAMSAAHTKTWKPLYEHYPAQGLPKTAALVILARRIARTAWSIFTHKTTFDAQRLTKQPSTRNAPRHA
jgi:transposase